MAIRQFQTDKRGVSPVIGVVLMVAVTVILAAIIGTFVMDMGSGVSAAPTSNFDFDEDSDTVTISHGGGETIEAANVEIRVGGTEVTDANMDSDFPTTIGAGSSAVVNKSAVSSGDTIQVVYLHPDSNKEDVLGEFTVA